MTNSDIGWQLEILKNMERIEIVGNGGSITGTIWEEEGREVLMDHMENMVETGDNEIDGNLNGDFEFFFEC